MLIPAKAHTKNISLRTAPTGTCLGRFYWRAHHAIETHNRMPFLQARLACRAVSAILPAQDVSHPTGPYPRLYPPYPPSNIFLFHIFFACFWIRIFATYSLLRRLQLATLDRISPEEILDPSPVAVTSTESTVLSMR